MISIYRLVNGIETVCCHVSEKSATYKEAIMGVWEVQVGMITEDELDIQTGDYLKYNGVNYTLNRDDEFTQKSDVEWVYDLIFEHPLYTLLDKLITNPLTGASTFQLTGKLVDFVDIVVWNTNKTVANPLGIDAGWTRGSIVDTDYKNISFSSMSCRDVLTTLSTEFNVEFLLNNKQINYVERIENATGLTFIQGKGNGLYEVTKQNVDKGDTITRIYPVGGNKNVPNANADEQGYLKLPEIYLENTTEIKRIVEKRVVFEDIFPFFLGSITSVGGTNNAEIICNDIDFNLTDIAIGSEARVNFLTGDLMGCSFEFQWNNALKKLTLIEQKDETALGDAAGNKPTVPSALKKAKVGDKFNFTGVIMPVIYVNNAIAKLRQKSTDWLSFYSRKRIKFDVQIDNRWMRGKPDLKAGDLVTIKIPQKNIEVLLRIASLEKNLYTGKISATVSNYLDEKWEKKVEGALSSLQTTVQTGLAGVGNVDILQSNDARPTSDNNIMSSLRSKSEFLSAKEADTAAERITFQKGAVIRDLATPDFVQDKFAGAGAGIFDDANGNSVLEVDKITVRKEAYFNEIIINQIRFQGGIMVYSAANLEVLSVVDGGSYLQLNFDTKNGQIANQFVVDDQIRCQRFAGGSVIKYYMSRVTSAGDDYIRISKTDIDGTLNVAVGDQVVQFGNRTNTARQSLIEVNVVDGGKQTFYQGVNSYNLIDKNAIEIGRVYDNSEWKTMMRLYGDLFIGDRNLSSYFKYNSTTKQMELAAHVLFKSGETYKEVGAGIADAKSEAVQLASNDATNKANSAKDTAISTASTDATNKSNAAIQTAKEYSDAKVAVINQNIADLQTQQDGEISNWSSNTQSEAPTLSNYPANQWTSDTIRDRHILDVYTNFQTYVDDSSTPNAGKSWKFGKLNGVYSWALIADNNQSKAYLLAAKAQTTANRKVTTYNSIPNIVHPDDGFCYRKGDLWSLQAVWNGFTAGELLSASQDSTSFVSSDWTKWVRYTGDEAVNNLRFGGTNLFPNSSFEVDAHIPRDVHCFISGTPFDDNILAKHGSNVLVLLRTGEDSTFIFNQIDLEPNTEYILSCDYVSAGAITAHSSWSYLQDENGGLINYIAQAGQLVLNTQKKWERYVLKFTTPNQKCSLRFRWGWHSSDDSWYALDGIMLTKGNVEFDWSPAISDVNAAILLAKQSGDNAQTTANTAQNTVNSLNVYVDGSFKDGIISQSEAQAIEKYKNQVIKDFNDLIAGYNIVYANSYLVGSAKTDLLNAKVSMAGAKDNLLTSINNAIADGKTTVSEKADVDSKYSAWDSSYATYKSKLELANKSIQSNLDSLAQSAASNAQSAATAVANTAQSTANDANGAASAAQTTANTALNTVNNLQIGIKNIVSRSRIQSGGVTDGYFYRTLSSSEDYIICNLDINETGYYTLVFTAKKTVNMRASRCFLMPANWPTQPLALYIGDMGLGTTDSKVIATFQIASNQLGNGAYIRIDNDGSIDGQPATLYVKDVMLVKGNIVPQSYIEAVEDDYVKKAIKGSASINGGLVLGNVMAVTDENGNVMAGMNGLAGAQYPIWSGAPNASNANFSVDKYGNLKAFSGQFGNFMIENGALVGYANNTEKVRLHTGALPTLDSLVNANWVRCALEFNISGVIGGVVNDFHNDLFVDTVYSTVTGYLSIPSNTNVKFHAQIIDTVSASPPDGIEISDFIQMVEVYNSGGSLVATNYLDGANVYLSAGTYLVKYTFQVSVNFTIQTTADIVVVSDSNAWMEYQGGITRLEMANDGFFMYYNATEYFYFKQGVGKFEKGFTDSPGVLAAGSIASGGGSDANKLWGAKKSSTAAQYTPTGQYRVFHNIGHSDYTVDICCSTAGAMGSWVTKASTYVDIQIYKNNAAFQSGFDYKLTGHN